VLINLRCQPSCARSAPFWVFLQVGVGSGRRIGLNAASFTAGLPIASGGAGSIGVPISKFMGPAPPLEEALAARREGNTRTFLGDLPVVSFAIEVRYKTISGAEHTVQSSHELRYRAPAQSAPCPMVGFPTVDGYASGEAGG
jgi:hypothetical protein